ncbi:MAG: DUF4271 domain-containing protein [Bacteroidota bacterium]
MNISKLLFGLCVLWGTAVVAQNTSFVQQRQQPDTFLFSTDTSYVADSLKADSLFTRMYKRSGFGLLDSIANDSLLRMMVKPYQFIVGTYYAKTEARRNLPTVKEIKIRDRYNEPWKFWVIVFVFIYISFVRIANPNNFRVFMLSVFNLKLSDKIWEDQRSFFGFVILQLFAIYLFIAAMFINDQLEVRNILVTSNYFLQFLLVLLILTGIYLLKFLMHTLLGVLLKMKKLGIGFVSNTISVNNFLALVIFPLIIFTVYYHHAIWSSVIAQTVVAVFFISVIYRVVRITLLSNRFFSFPRIYLFIYLCALEIVPWFVIVKFLNNFQI